MQTLAIGFRHAVGEFRDRLAERTGLTGGFGDRLALGHNFLKQKARRHQLVFLALLEHVDELVEYARHLVQARDVVLDVLGAVEWNRRGELRKLQMKSVELVDRHLVELEIGAADAVLQLAHHQFLVQAILFAEPASIDRLKRARNACAPFFAACASVTSLSDR